MKIKSSRVLDLLKLLGLQDVQLVEEDGEEDYTDEDFFTAVDTSRTPVIKPKVAEELMNDIKGKTGGILKTVLVRKTGIERKALEGMTDEQAIEAALLHRESKYSQDSQSMRDQLDGITKGHQDELEKFKAEYEQKLADARNKYISRDIIDHVDGILSKMNLPESADRKQVAQMVKGMIEQDVDLGYDEENRVPLTFQKGTQNPALNSTKQQAFDWKEAITNKLTPLGLLRNDMRDKNPAEAMGGRGQEYQPAGMAQTPKGSVTDYNNARQAFMEKAAAQ